MEPKNGIYYAALLSPEARHAYSDIQPATLVSPDKEVIIDLCKKNKGARFKVFRSYHDALKYAEEEPEESSDITTNGTSNIAAEVAPPFPSVDTYQINEFKRKIETKDLPQVESMIQLNPRFLINYISDDPTIIRQGTRYNAVLLAAFVKAPDILAYLLETINSLSFIRRCYPLLSEESLIIEKRDRLLEAFLNTPEKVTFNTPLHFACRAADLRCIKVLLDYVPTIDINRKNKSGKVPLEMVSDVKLKPTIEEMFSACMFVTVVRSDDDLNVTISQPCYGRRSIDDYATSVDNRSISKISTIVGPMTPDAAKLIYETLKSPKRCSDKQRTLRIRDPIRGVEKVARDLSLNLHVPCKEYWPFLGGFVDISATEGLERLEQHLKRQSAELSFRQIFSKLSLYQGGLEGDQINGHDRGDDDEPEQEDTFYDAEDEDFDDDDDIYYSAPSTPTDEKQPLQPTIYMTGEVKGQVDTDVLAALNLAIDQGILSIEKLKETYPLLFNWYTLVLTDDAQR